MKKKRRLNMLAIFLAAMLAFSSVGTAFAAPEGEAAVEELVLEEEESIGEAEEVIAEDASEAVSEEASEVIEEESEEESSEVIEEETAEAVEEETAEVIEEETTEAVEEETSEAIEEETTEAVEEETTEAIEEETTEAIEEETTEAIEEETTEAVEEETTEAVEEIEEIGGETITPEKLEATIKGSTVISPVQTSYKGKAITTIPASRYVDFGYDAVTDYTYTKVSTTGTGWLSVNSSTGEITGTPGTSDVHVASDRVLKVKVTRKSSGTVLGTAEIRVNPTYVKIADRIKIEEITVSTTSSQFYNLQYGQYLPKLSNFTNNYTSGNDLTVTAKWQSRTYMDYGEDAWTDCLSTDKVEEWTYYRVQLTLKWAHNTDNGQKFDFTSATKINLQYSDIESNIFSCTQKSLSQGNDTVASTLVVNGPTWLPRFYKSWSASPSSAASSIVMGETGYGWFSMDHEKLSNQGIHNGGSGEFLYVKVTPATGYALASVKMPGGDVLPVDDFSLGVTYSGGVTNLKVDASDCTWLAGQWTFNFVKAPTALNLSAASKTMTIAEKATLTGSVLPADCTLPVTWTSSNPSVLEVYPDSSDSHKGDLYANAEGTATVTATVTGGGKTFSKTCTVTVKKPTMTATAANSADGVELNWTKVPGAHQYRIYRNSSLIKTIYDDSTISYVDETATTGNTYTYYVQAGWYPSTESSFTQLCKSADIQIQYVPEITITAIANTSKGVVLAWNEVPGATYTVQRALKGGSKTTIASGISAATYTVPLSGMTSGKEYEYTVIAKKGSTTLSETTESRYYIGVTTMNAPTCTASGLRVTWPKVPGAVKYVVFRHIGSGAINWKYLTTVTATDAATQVFNNNTTFTPGQWYAYTVRAIGPKDPYGNDTYGGQPAGRSVRYREPVNITKVQSVSNGVKATFTTVAAGYTYGLYRADVKNGEPQTYSLVATTTSTGVNTSVQVTDTTAVSGKGYSYYVRCMSKDKKVPLSSFKNNLMITYKKP